MERRQAKGVRISALAKAVRMIAMWAINCEEARLFNAKKPLVSLTWRVPEYTMRKVRTKARRRKGMDTCTQLDRSVIPHTRCAQSQTGVSLLYGTEKLGIAKARNIPTTFSSCDAEEEPFHF